MMMMTILTRKRSFPGQQIHKYCSQLRQFYFIRPGPITRSLNTALCHLEGN